MSYRDLLIEGLNQEGKEPTPEEIALLDFHITELAELLADFILTTRDGRGHCPTGKQDCAFDGPDGPR